MNQTAGIVDLRAVIQSATSKHRFEHLIVANLVTLKILLPLRKVFGGCE